ncbi:glycosyltransferase [Cellulophaga sp. 20_2_10]|uniref:glycosyltransferase n=1 Tax=Cellulophaga sp. 20_2_10 TaxID=2942476 RepID=UPI00201A884C|nr:glycosyltransferase [Cellulophaga sp. 20_2_10]MCL5244787.1 glycosyltransferase [Cellulophaga sp. 20_2_10]
MKILQIINNLQTGGAEKLLLESIPLFNKEENIMMDLVVLNNNNAPFFKEFKKKSATKIFILSKGTPYNPSYILKIIPFLKKYDVVHVHLFPSLYWVALAKILSFSKAKLIYTEHNTSNRRREKLVFKIIDKLIYSQYSKIITISDDVDIELKKHLKFKDSRFELIQNGVNLNTIKNETGYLKSELAKNINENHKILLQVSSFTTQKDQKTLIKSLEHLDKNIIAVLVGDGPLKVECEELAHKLNLTDRVFFLGIRMDVPKILKTADIIVLSTHYEGLSLASIEGLASGRPFIASDVPGLKDIVRGAGLLFEENDSIMLAKHIVNLLRDNSYYNEIAGKCLKRAENYDINETINKQITLYQTISQEV